MRIGIISTTYPPRVGGMETYVAALAEALVRLGHDVTVITNRNAAAEPADAVVHGVRIRRTAALLAGWNDPARVPWEEALFGVLPEVEAFVTEASVDVVHTQTQASLLLAGMLGLGEDRPVVASFHETDPVGEPGGRRRCEFVLRACAPDLVIAGSEYFAEQARQFGMAPDRIRVVTMGVLFPPVEARDEDAARRRLRERVGIPEDGQLLTVIGRFKERKGQRRLLDAYRYMARADDARILLVGSCSSASMGYRDELYASIREHGLSDRVSILEDVSEDVRDLVLDASSVVVQPSTLEGLGLAAIEAFGRGCAVVVSDVPGLREVASKGGGVAVDTDDPARLAEVLDVLVADPRRRRLLGDAASAAARRQFGIARSASDTVLAYEEVLAEQRRQTLSAEATA